MSERIHLIIVEDDNEDLDEFVNLLSAVDTIDIVGTASHLEAVISTVEKYEFEVALVDMRIPERAKGKADYKYGLHALTHIARMQPQARILAITSFDQEYSLVFKSIQSGAHGYILKRGSDEEII